MSNPNDYTVGWICAITTEYVAAQEFLDEEHEGPEFVSPHDNNHYTLGKVGKHNVVIAVLPDNEYGKSSAASVARDMMHSFPNVRFGLMVGIAGGAPGKHDIRLGDIVVGCGGNGMGGVFGYDFGKAVQGQGFQETGFCNQPPTLLRTTVNGLKARYERKGHQLSEAVDKVLEDNKRLRRKYNQPEPGTNNLFKSEVTHDSTCGATCSDDISNLISRPERSEDEDSPVVHYGLIASADRLMKDALERDRLSKEKEVLCFEMEAAGLMNHFPCLVVRGICDYSDSHKNKQWQGYAAMVAAAYAKDILYEIAPKRVEAERKISDIISDIREVSQEHHNIAKEQLQAQKDQAEGRLLKEQRKCHQLFRLTTNKTDATYEWYKDRVEERVEGTCMWFLKHDHFQTWLNQESGPLLVSADPGCGKSVLAKFLVDHQLPRSSTICYFFFKDQDQNTVRQALCALLHQLFSLNPPLIEHAMPQYFKNGERLINSTESLWEVLRNTVKDPRTGPVTIVLDALDECAELEFKDLVRNIKDQFRSDQVGYGSLKYLLTCRPYSQIMDKFNILSDSFPNIRIPGEEESEVISQEVNHVIMHKIDQLVIEKRFNVNVKNHLENKLQEVTHRTYLWVYLVFDYLQSHSLKKTLKGIESAISALPKSVNEAYEQILSKTNQGPMVRKALCITLAAYRPLTISEMNIAMNVDDECQSPDDLDLEDDEDFQKSLRSMCGLFLSIYQGRIYFLHQTAREFLLSGSTLSQTVSSKWHQSITTRQAHATLAEICVLILYFAYSFSTRESTEDIGLRTLTDDYSTNYWDDHVREADFMESASIIPAIMRIYHSGVPMRVLRSPSLSECSNDLMIASSYGHRAIINLLLANGAEIEAENTHGETPLLVATKFRQEDSVKMLLQRGADTEAKDHYDQTPLHKAAGYKLEAILKLLLDKGADTEAKDQLGRTPLLLATRFQDHVTIGMLLEHGADASCVDTDNCTPLGFAIEVGDDVLTKLLLEKGASVDCENGNGETPLLVAVQRSRQRIVELLLENGAAVDCRNAYRKTPLSIAAQRGHGGIVRRLLEKGASVQSEDIFGQTALSCAVQNGYQDIVDLLTRDVA